MSGASMIIKKLRKQKGMTLDALARLTGLTKGYLSKVERAPSLPPFSTLELIAKALDIDVTSLLEKRSEVVTRPDLDLTRENERVASAMFQSSDSCAFISLLRSYKGKYMTPILVRFEPGGEREFEHDGEEFVYVLSGAIALFYEDEEHELKADDCFYLDSRKKHRFANRADKEAVLLSITFNYRRF